MDNLAELWQKHEAPSTIEPFRHRDADQKFSWKGKEQGLHLSPHLASSSAGARDALTAWRYALGEAGQEGDGQTLL